MQSSWYANDGVGGGAGSVVYDGGGGGGNGGYYGGENVSFYGPPAMSMTYAEKPKSGFNGAPYYPGPTGPGPMYSCGPEFGGFGGTNGGGQMLPYEYPNHQGLAAPPPQGVLHHHRPEMAAPTSIGTVSNNNDYHHQQLVPPGGGGAYHQPFYQGPPPPPPSGPSAYAEMGETVDLMSQNVSQASYTAPFLEQPYVAASYAPCQGPPPWNYAHCYGYYGQEPCPYVNMVDMEDFM
ncbi:AGAP002942-PA-like protein [Anopheles sinensis]|uniref:AGAP002942-PA-like protein n=1 Tax=Anopheles sinensis TaxID=74873 RepID=A0A084W763_ANOSI|nr:AGAP002942-PA-like protein [Anopheles sinensis]